MSDMDRIGIPDNILDRVKRLEEALLMLQTRNLRADSLAEISTVLGDMAAGRFIASDDEDDLEPTSTGFSGMVMAAALQTLADGNTARLAEILNGVAQFWVGNGKAHAGAGAVALDENGIAVSQYGDAVVFGDELSPRVASIAFSKDGEYFSIKNWKPTGGSITDLVVNGDAEDGDLTGWSASLVSPGSASAVSTEKKTGTYGFKLLNSSALGGTCEFETTDYIALTGGATYIFSVWVKGPNTATTYSLAEVKLYDSSSVLLNTLEMRILETTLTGWRKLGFIVRTSATTAKAKIKFTNNDGTIYLDNIQLYGTDVGNEIQFTDDGIGFESDGTVSFSGPVSIGELTATNLEVTGGVVVDLASDGIGFRLQAHSTQTNNLFVVETSTGVDLVTISGAGKISQVYITTQPTSQDDGMYLNTDLYVTGAMGQNVNALRTLAQYRGGANFFGTLAGFRGTAYNNSAYSIANLLGMTFRVGVLNASASVTNGAGIDVGFLSTAAGAMTNGKTLNLVSPSGAMVITNLYGLYIEAMAAGSTLNYAIYTNAGDIRLMASAADKIGLHGSAPVAKQTITGSRGGNAALTSLLAALATRGDFVNSTT